MSALQSIWVSGMSQFLKVPVLLRKPLGFFSISQGVREIICSWRLVISFSPFPCSPIHFQWSVRWIAPSFAAALKYLHVFSLASHLSLLRPFIYIPCSPKHLLFVIVCDVSSTVFFSVPTLKDFLFDSVVLFTSPKPTLHWCFFYIERKRRKPKFFGDWWMN